MINSNWAWRPIWEKENLEFKPVNLSLKIDLVSYPVRGKGVDIYSIIIIKSQCQCRFSWLSFSLSPSLLTTNRHWNVFQTTSRVRTKLMRITCWSANTSTSIFRGQWRTSLMISSLLKKTSVLHVLFILLGWL